MCFEGDVDTKIKIDNKVKNVKTVWLEGNQVKMINQSKLPYMFEIFTSNSALETIEAIKQMIVRGAPAIGCSAAYAIVQAALEIETNIDLFWAHIEEVAELLRNSRPTGKNLSFAIDRVLKKMREGKNIKEYRRLAIEEAELIAKEDIEFCRKIGEHGKDLIKSGDNVLVHCNPGALGTIEYGTALAIIRFAYHHDGKEIFVYVNETRPKCQGSRLTAWELIQEEIPFVIIADNTAGHFMKNGKIDLVIVGADRIAKNGDTANKIGTYSLAVLAKENKIPFYVAASSSTFDLGCDSGLQIPIENRSEDEIKYFSGLDEEGVLRKIKIGPEEAKYLNPAFDITPAEYITAFITEKGIKFLSDTLP